MPQNQISLLLFRSVWSFSTPLWNLICVYIPSHTCTLRDLPCLSTRWVTGKFDDIILWDTKSGWHSPWEFTCNTGAVFLECLCRLYSLFSARSIWQCLPCGTVCVGVRVCVWTQSSVEVDLKNRIFQLPVLHLANLHVGIFLPHFNHMCFLVAYLSSIGRIQR